MKLKFIWQYTLYPEREWISEIFSSVAGEQVVDGNHRIVLDDCLLIDSWLHFFPPSYYAQFRGKNAWLIHLYDETYEGGYEAYRNFRGVFRCYRSNIFDPRHVFQLPLGYTPGFTHQDENLDIERRRYLWSFLGQGNKASRPEMLRALMPLAPNFAHNTDLPGVPPLDKQEYRDMLLDSIFVPCPMGNVNLDSFRVYEALQCGAIPILERRLTLDYFAGLLGTHPLPTFNSWDQAARFIIAIRDDKEAMSRLQRSCFDWWIDYKQRLPRRIDLFLAASANEQPHRSTHWTYSLPGWQLVELMRHQTIQTCARRTERMLRRLTTEGRLRKTYGK